VPAGALVGAVRVRRDAAGSSLPSLVALTGPTDATFPAAGNLPGRLCSRAETLLTEVCDTSATTVSGPFAPGPKAATILSYAARPV
jgi:hypothetical protein